MDQLIYDAFVGFIGLIFLTINVAVLGFALVAYLVPPSLLWRMRFTSYAKQVVLLVLQPKAVLGLVTTTLIMFAVMYGLSNAFESSFTRWMAWMQLGVGVIEGCLNRTIYQRWRRDMFCFLFLTKEFSDEISKMIGGFTAKVKAVVREVREA